MVANFVVGLFRSRSRNFAKPFVPSESALNFGHTSGLWFPKNTCYSREMTFWKFSKFSFFENKKPWNILESCLIYFVLRLYIFNLTKTYGFSFSKNWNLKFFKMSFLSNNKNFLEIKDQTYDRNSTLIPMVQKVFRNFLILTKIIQLQSSLHFERIFESTYIFIDQNSTWWTHFWY